MTFLSDAALERLREAADAPDLAGTRYRLMGKLGQGGMGGVFRVEDPALEREVALKVVHIADGARGLTERLLQEARVIAKLEHPGIVPVHDVGALPDGRPYYTMKLVQGERLEEHVASVTGLSDRLRIFLRICDAVGFAHAHGVIHRDLKPANIMVGPFGEVLVMDWGLSKLLAPSKSLAAEDQPTPDAANPARGQTRTAHGSVLGTAGFMAPEQTRGDDTLDERADIYSLGAILSFLLKGSSSQAVPRALTAIRAKAMADSRNQRYSGVPELAADVAHFLDGLAVAAYPEGLFGRSWRWIVRNRTWILLLLAYMVTRVLLILFRPR
ncbi:MAG TPA: serine/threonine-protein kinase [Terriglobales bacterium]|nr:serine/threonine-protein kinase [Terriglobales bacterium]